MNSDSIGSILNVVSSLQKQTSSASKESKDASRGVSNVAVQLDDIEARIKNIDATAYNSRVWRPYHRLAKVRALVKESSRNSKSGSSSSKPDMAWKVHQDFPHTIREFKELAGDSRTVRGLLEFYDVTVYRDDDDDDDEDDDISARVDLRSEVKQYIVPCMEALAATWGLDWDKMHGLAKPAARGAKAGRGRGDGGRGDLGRGDGGRGDAGRGDNGRGDNGRGDGVRIDNGRGDGGRGDAGRGDGGRGDGSRNDGGAGAPSARSRPVSRSDSESPPPGRRR